MVEAGLPDGAIAHSLGVSTEVVRYRRQKAGVARPQNTLPERVATLLRDGRTVKEIAEQLNLSPHTVRRRARELGIKPHRTYTIKPAIIERDRTLCRIFQEGKHTLEEMGQMFNLTRERVRQVLVRNGISDRYKWTIRNSGKLDRLKELYEQGETFEDIAKTLGVSVSVINAQPKTRASYNKRRIAQFWKQVAITADTAKCWNWQGLVYGYYGRYGWRGKPSVYAHRVAFEIYHGRTPTKWVLHHCDNGRCVNPHHLYEGTPQDNVRDRDSRGRGSSQNGKDPHWLTLREVEQIKQMLADGVPQHLIAEQFNVVISTINNINTGKTWATNKRTRSSLSPDVVRTIRQRLAKGAKQRALAVEYGVHSSAIQRINVGRTFKDEIFFP